MSIPNPAIEVNNGDVVYDDPTQPPIGTIVKDAEGRVTIDPIKKEKTIPVVEIFGPTIQGEGIVCGQRTVFIRFGLCDYKCVMCDSMHAVDPAQVKANSRWLTQLEIASEVLELLHQTNCRNVTYSGGNPCIHDLTNLTRALSEAGIHVSLETQGTRLPLWVHQMDYITISPKGPGMGEKFETGPFMDWIHTFAPTRNMCIKVVIFSAQDLEFASNIVDLLPPYLMNEDRFYLSIGNPYPPGINHNEAGMLYSTDTDIDAFASMIRHQTEQIMEDLKGFPALARARVLPQVHTLLWGQAKGR